MINQMLKRVKEIPNLADKYEKFVCIWIDGLGQMDLNLNFQHELCQTIFPSSTVPFLYSFHSFQSPAEHGYLAWYYPVDNKIIKLPSFIDIKTNEPIKEISITEFFPFKTLSERLYEKGINHVYYTPFQDSPFTKLTSKHATVKPLYNINQLAHVKIQEGFTFFYYDKLDTLMHKYGKNHLKIKKELEKIRFSTVKFSELNEDTAIMVFSDHGHSEIKEYLSLPEIDGISPLGESRVAFYRLSIEEVKEYLNPITNKVKIVGLQDLQLYSKRAEKKYGKTVVLPKVGYGLRYPFEKTPITKVSSHGGNTNEEMIVKVWTRWPD